MSEEIKPSSAAVEAARLKLVSAACQYAGGTAFGEKCPGLIGSEIYQMVMKDLDEGLRTAALNYFAVVCAPPDKS